MGLVAGSGCPAAEDNRMTTGPAEAAANDAARIRLGVLGATNGKPMIQTHSHGMPTNPVISDVSSSTGNTPQNSLAAMPNAPTTSNANPRLRMRAGGMSARLE